MRHLRELLDIVIFTFISIAAIIAAGAAPFIGGYLAGGWGVLIGVMFSIGLLGNVFKDEGSNYIALCHNCGSSGSLVASGDGRDKYRCEECRNSWTKKWW